MNILDFGNYKFMIMMYIIFNYYYRLKYMMMLCMSLKKIYDYFDHFLIL